MTPDPEMADRNTARASPTPLPLLLNIKLCKRDAHTHTSKTLQTKRFDANQSKQQTRCVFSYIY